MIAQLAQKLPAPTEFERGSRRMMLRRLSSATKRKAGVSIGAEAKCSDGTWSKRAAAQTMAWPTLPAADYHRG